MNPEMLEDVYNASQRSQGSAQRELDTYLDSIEAKYAQLQNRLQQLAYTAIDSDAIKVLLDGLSGAVSFATKLVDVLGTIPSILGVVSAMFMKKTGLGFLNFDKNAEQQFSLGFQKLWERAITNIKLPSKEVAKVFGQMDLDKAYLPQLLQLEKQGVIIPESMWNVDGIENFSEELTSARTAMTAFGQVSSGITGLLSNLGNVASVVGTTLLNAFGSAIVMALVSFAITGVGKVIDSVIHAKENAIQLAKETQEEIDTITSENEAREQFQNSDKYERAIELSSKIAVNKDGYKNISATNDEYQEYISLCNEIAGIYPEVVSSYDAQGNAIIDLGSNAEEAKTKLDELNKASAIAEGFELKGTSNKTWLGKREEIADALKERDEAQIELENQRTTKEVFSDNAADSLRNQLKSLQEEGTTHIDIGALSGQDYAQLEESIRDVAESLNMDLYISPTSGANGTLDLMMMKPLEDANAWEQFYSVVASSVPQAAGEASLAILESSGKVNDATNKANQILQEQLENSWEELSHSVSYMELVSGNSVLEEAIKNALFSSSLEDVDGIDDFQGWVESNYLKPITQAFSMEEGKAAQDAINNLFTLDSSKLSVTKYDQTLKDNLAIVEDFYKSIGQEELYESFLINYDFAFKTPNGQIIKNDRDAIYRELKDYLVDEKFTDETESELDTLTWDQLLNVESLVKDNSFSGKISDAIKKVVDQGIKKASPTDTLKTLLSDETFKSDVDYANYEGNLSSLTSALETLRTEGSLTAETMVSLQKSMPSLTDFTEGSLKDAAFQQLDSWIQRIREGMSTMSEEGKEQTQTMIQNMINQYGDLGTTMEDIYKMYSGGVGVDSSNQQEWGNRVRAGFNSQVDELRSRLAAEGKELDYHVLYTLVASDQFSGTAEEIYENYNDAEIKWQITVDEKNALRDIAVAEAKMQSEQAKRSAKEARGETITPEDYQAELDAANGKINTTVGQVKRARDAWKEAIRNGSDDETVDNLFIAYQNELAGQRQAEAEAANTAREQTESAANETLKELENSNNSLKNVQNKITEAEKDGGKASTTLYETLASEQDNQAEINRRLGDIFQGFADNADNNEADRIKWQGQANDYYASAIQAENEAKESRNQPILNEYNQLQTQAEQIQREITRAEQNHQKVSTQTYRSLIDNGEMQIRNLQSQQSEVEKYSEDWWNLQNSIDSAQDSIYDWSKTMDQLVVTQASELASTLSSAMSEQFSDTGLTSDTMDALLTAFSDLTGNNLDISDAFYNTADGIKVNTQAIEELTEAEFDLQSAQLQQQIDMVQEALERNPGNSALNQKLQQLLQTQAQYFAQYEEMQKALSRNAAMGLAEQTANQGANFDSNISRFQTYQEAYKKGYTGTDDFEAWTAYLDVYGRTGKDVYEGVKDKAERYFGQKKDDNADEIAGLQNFLDDLEKLGYATKSETTPGGYDLKFDSYENASKAMGMGQEWFEDMLGKLEERGFDIMSVSSLTDSALQMQDLEAQRKQALATYMDMRDRGASKEDLSSQLELVDELGTKMQRLSILTEDWQQTTEDARKMNFANLQSNLAELERLASETEDEATKNIYREEAAKEAAEFGYTLKEGGFSLSEADAADYASRFVGGTLQSPLSAAQMGYGPEVADKYVAMVNKVSEAYQNEDGNVQSLVDTLNKYDKDKLWNIDHADGKWSDGEKEVEQLCDALGIGYDNAKLLIDTLAGLGLIKTPDSITSLPDTFAESKQQLDGLLASAQKGSGAAYQIDTSDDYTGKTLDQLRTQQSEVRQMLADTVWDETNQGAKEYLEQLDRNVTARIEIETVLSKGDTTLKQLQDLDDEQLAAKFNVDVNSDEFIALKQQLEQLQNSYDLEIHIDDTQFDQLMTALVGEDWETTVNVKADTEEYDETVSSLEPPDVTNTGEQEPDSAPSNPVQNATQSGQNAVSNFLTGNNVTATENENTGFTEEYDQTEQTAENVSVNAQNVQVNDDTNTPGSIAKGESLTSEQRQEYSSTSETEPKLYGSPRDPSLYSSTDYDFVGAHENGANPIAQIWDSLFGGSKESEQVETAVINATTAEVNSDTVPNDDTNTPGTLSKGESLTSEQRSEYSSTSETPEGEAYEPESQTSTAVINADVAELNAGLPNETDPNYQPQPTIYNPDPLNYGGLQGYDRTQTPGVVPAPQSVPYSEPAVATTPGELSASEVSVSGGSVTVSGPVEMPTSTPTETSTFTPTPTVTSAPAPEAPTTETTTTVTVEADVTPAEEAIAGLGNEPVTIGVQIETPQPEEFQGVLDRVSNSGPQSVQVDASVQDGATEGLQEVENKANEVDGLNPTVTAETQDNASSVLNSVISTSQEVDAQAPNVSIEATDNASDDLNKVKGLADNVEGTDPNVSVSASTGNTISVLTDILNKVNQLPPSRTINITTKYTTIGNPPGQASGTFHPAQNLGTVKSAFADGTVGKLWDDYSRQNSLGAYARGTDVTLSRNQDALVNEVGIESIVFYVRTYTVMCMQLFIKLRGHPKANQATT